MPVFSIIVPVYNVEKYLNKCVDSVLAQSFRDFEIILVDDGSTDSCPVICDSYQEKDSRVQVVHSKNGGPSSARNQGISKAQGEYVWFIDGDDCIHPKALETLCNYLHKSDIVNFGYCIYSVENQVDFSKNQSRYPFDGVALKNDIYALMKKACSCVLLPYVWRNIYRRDFLLENGILFDADISYGEDSVFNMEAFLKADRIVFAKEYLYGYCMRSDSLSKSYSQSFDSRVVDSVLLYDKKRDEIYEKLCPHPEEEYYQDAGRFMIESLYMYAFLYKMSKSSSKKSYRLFKSLSDNEAIKKAFCRFDLNKIKSRSLEWLMFFFVKHKIYFPAYIIYRIIF